MEEVDLPRGFECDLHLLGQAFHMLVCLDVQEVFTGTQSQRVHLIPIGVVLDLVQAGVLPQWGVVGAGLGGVGEEEEEEGEEEEEKEGGRGSPSSYSLCRGHGPAWRRGCVVVGGWVGGWVESS